MSTADNASQTQTTAAPATKKTNSGKIDALIQAVQLRNKRAVDANPDTVAKLAQAKEQSKAAEQARAEAKKLRDAARSERKVQREQDSAARAEKRTARKAEVEAKRAAREAQRAAKAAAKGRKAPELTGDTKDTFDRISGFDLASITALYAAVGLLIKQRSIGAVGKMTEADRPEPGDHVRIIGGEHAGKTGHVSKAQRIRCFVDLEGLPEGKKKNVYLYISQVEVLPDSTAKKAAKKAPEPVDATTEAAAPADESK